MSKNVLFLCCDCLRADRVFSYHRELVPNMRKLMGESVYFTKAFSVGPNTPNSYQSIFGHIYPSEASGLGTIPENIETVPETFVRCGYSTYGFNAGNAWLSEYYGYHRGFMSFESYLALSSELESQLLLGEERNYRTKLYNSLSSLISLVRNKLNSNQLVLNFLRKVYPRKLLNFYKYVFFSKDVYLRETKLEWSFLEDILTQIREIDEQPFFMWAHFMTPHPPLIPMKQKFSRGCNIMKLNYLHQEDKLGDLYDDCVFTFDSYVGEIIHLLKANNLFNNTIIVISADHGELLSGPRAPAHPSEVVYELLHVPLIIKFDNSKISGQIDENFSTIGLFSSIFSYLGLDYKIKHNINSFRVQDSDLNIQNSDFIFFEARDFQDAFKEKCERTKEVSAYGVMTKNHFLNYDSKHGVYGNVEDETIKTELSNKLSKHIQQSIKQKTRKKVGKLKESGKL